MWVDLGLMGASFALTIALGLSVCSLRKRAASGCYACPKPSLWVTAILWTVLGALLFLNRAVNGIPAIFVFIVYLIGGVGEVASVIVLRERKTDAIAAFGLRAGIIAIPLVLIIFVGFSI